MEVKISYTIDIYGRGRGGSMISRQKSVTDQTIKLRPHGSSSLLAKVEIMNYNDINSEFPDFGAIDSAFITNFELINFKVIEKNYEIR
jgi:hypothetical protein